MATNVVLKLRETHYPIAEIEEPRRPYRLWNAKEKQPLRWRNYSSPRNAHLGALIEARWGEIGTVIEVYDSRTAALLGQYKRTVHSVAFYDVRKDTQEEM
jgi:hypothetical protein